LRKPPTGSARLCCSYRLITCSTAPSIAPTARAIRPSREAPTGAPNCSARGWSPSAAPTASSCAPLGSSARTARISSARAFRQRDARRGLISVVADQRGNPTSALDLAAALLAIAARVREEASPALRGVFHMTGSSEARWADFAEAIFIDAEARGRRPTRVKRITTADYPTPARRPANSRLDNEKLRRIYGLKLPDWRKSLAACCARLIP